MNHVIIEGSDGAGKTTLAKALCKLDGYAYHHEGPPPKGVSVLHHYAALLAHADEPTVFDRFHLGELVYGPLLRGRSGLAPRELALMNRLITGLGVATVICLPPWEKALANTRDRKELITDDDVLEQAYVAWSALAEQDLPNVQVHDYTKADFVLRQHASLPPGVIGDPVATVLFVGEQPNSVELDLPFFGTARSSGYLNERLEEAGFTDRFALTNALRLNGKPRDLRAIIGAMRPKLRLCVALGQVAAKALFEAGAPKVADLPHPQFWKRFHAKEPHLYVEQLRRTRCFA